MSGMTILIQSVDVRKSAMTQQIQDHVMFTSGTRLSTVRRKLLASSERGLLLALLADHPAESVLDTRDHRCSSPACTWTQQLLRADWTCDTLRATSPVRRTAA